MLFNKTILQALNSRLGNRHNQFNIHLFLQMLQSTTRPLGYPDHKKNIDDSYYIELIRSKILNAQQTRNGDRFHSLMKSIFQVMVCFTYFQDTLNLDEVDDDLKTLLYRAIEEREDTTEEERCSEKSLLAMIICRPQAVIKLISDYSSQLNYFDIQQLLKEKITLYGNKCLKRVVNDIEDDCSLDVSSQKIADLLIIFKKTDESIALLSPYSKNPKEMCKVVIGGFLLKHYQRNLNEKWVSSSGFLQAALLSAKGKTAKDEIDAYIKLRSAEGNTFSCCWFFSQKTKLTAAEKFKRVLNNEQRVYFSHDELAALKSDGHSRLTTIYERYKNLINYTPST